MDKFAKWTGLAHATLSKHHPKFKRSHASECLAAWLGHRTYASLRVKDLKALMTTAKYVIVDSAAAAHRAPLLGFDVTPDQWNSVEMILRPSGISGGLWLTTLGSMASAACLSLEDTVHPDMLSIWKPIGMSDGAHGHRAVCQAAPGTLPDDLRFVVEGEIRAFNENESLAVPLTAEVSFEKLGARLYAEGRLLRVTPSGTPQPYEPDYVTDSDYISDSSSS